MTLFKKVKVSGELGQLQVLPGTGNGHRLINETLEMVIYLEVGDRSLGDEVLYPDDDLKAVLLDGKWSFQYKDGTPY